MGGVVGAMNSPTNYRSNGRQTDLIPEAALVRPNNLRHFLCWMSDSHPEVEKLSLVDSFYCVCSTITTLGYGDKSFSTKGGRIFAVFWILTSTICVAQFFLYLAELQTERRQQQLAKWVLNRRMTFMDLKAADLDYDGVLSAAEFVIYKLKEMGKIRPEDIALVLEEFENLDVDQSGTLTTSDLVLAQSTN